MSVKQEISLVLTCVCPYCRIKGYPLVASFFGQSIEECYKTAVQEGWIFLRERDRLHWFSKKCLFGENYGCEN